MFDLIGEVFAAFAIIVMPLMLLFIGTALGY